MIRRTVSLVASYHLMPPPLMKCQEVKCLSYFWCLMDLPVFFIAFRLKRGTDNWWTAVHWDTNSQWWQTGVCVRVRVGREVVVGGGGGQTLMEKTFLKNLEDKAVSPTLCLQPIRRLLQPDESLIEEHSREGGWFSYFLMSFLRGGGGSAKANMEEMLPCFEASTFYPPPP